MYDSFWNTLGIVLLGIGGGAILALIATHPKATWTHAKKMLRRLLPEHPPRQIPYSFYKFHDNK